VKKTSTGILAGQ